MSAQTKARSGGWVLWGLTSICLVILLALGAWQWARMQEREAQFAAIAAAALAPPLDARALTGADAALEYRAIAAVIDADARAISLFGPRPRTFQRVRLGDGRILLAETGIGGGAAAPGAAVDGVARLLTIDPGKPADNTAKAEFFQPGPMLAAALGVTDATWYIAARRVVTPSGATMDNPRADPRASAAGPERHLGYALTWFGLAIGLLVVATLLHRRGADRTVVPR
jgi:surfeit locus 1 family protein